MIGRTTLPDRWTARIVALTVASWAMSAPPVLAQEATLEADSEQSQLLVAGDELPADTIVVTGTLLGTQGDRGTLPVDVITARDLERAGAPSLLDLVRSLPASAGVLGDSAPFDGRSQFNQGSASINLRGLGPQRTLVLLNGRRIAQSVSGNVPLVDINLMPIGALDRIEILKDGAAATYGSDAVAGVVNFVTREAQEGFVASADYRFIDGSDGDWSTALSWGGQSGAARLLFSAGWQHRSELRPSERQATLLPYAQNPQGGWSGGGNPGNFDFDGRLNGLAFTADEGCEAAGGFRSLFGSTSDLCFTNFLAFSNLIEPEDRIQLFGDVEIDLSSATRFRVTALAGHTDTVLNTSPSFLPTIAPSANAAFGGTGLFTIPAYAPALTDYCARFGEAAGCALDASGAPAQAALAFPVRFRPFLVGGNPLFDNDRRTAALDRTSQSVQLTAQAVHQLDDGLALTAGLTWSSYFRRFEVGDAFVDLFQNALAGFGGPDCRFASPASRAGLSAEQLATVAGTQGCTFFNPFSTAIEADAITGQGNPNYAGAGNPLGLSSAPGAGLVNELTTIDHFYNVWERTASTRQFVADLVLAGGSGIALAGGELQFALGAQYRRDNYARTYQGGTDLDQFPCPGSVLGGAPTCDPQTGALGFIGAGRDVSASSDVAAVFGELQAPVTRRLSLQLAARYEHYGAGTGATFDPQLRARYELARGLTFRSGVGTTFRAPPPQNTGADLVVLTFIGGAFRAVDLLADPDLSPERATSWNAGLTLDRSGLTANLDLWRTHLTGAIEAEPVSGIVQALFGANGRANCGNPAFAALEARFNFAGGSCGAANVQRVTTFAFNSADITTSGIDLGARYDWRTAGGMDFRTGVEASYVLEYKVADTLVEGVLVQPAFDAAGKLNFQTTAYPLPRLKGRAWVEAQAGRHALRLQASHVGSYTDQRSELFMPNNATLAGMAVTRGERIGAFNTFDAIGRWQAGHGLTLTLALLNVLDEAPPFARLDQNYDPLTAHALGRTALIALATAF